MAKTSYAFASGAVRAHETALLTRQDMDQLLALRTPERVTAALRDKGYGLPAGDRENMEDLLRQERAKLWEYLRSLVPDFQLFTPFLVQNDYQNAQTVLKGVLRDKPYAHLLLEPWSVEPARLEAAVRERKFSALPARLGTALDKAYDLLAACRQQIIGLIQSGSQPCGQGGKFSFPYRRLQPGRFYRPRLQQQMGIGLIPQDPLEDGLCVLVIVLHQEGGKQLEIRYEAAEIFPQLRPLLPQ